MSENAQSLSHSKWDCKYQVVFVPNRRRQELFGHLRQKLGAVFRELARQKEWCNEQSRSARPLVEPFRSEPPS
jgi:putative transposase